MFVYREYDQEELNAQYNNRLRVPEFEDIVARWREASAEARPAPGARLDLRYGAGAREDLDFFPAPGAGGATPLLAFIHGGYWQSLSKDVFAFVAPNFTAAGIAVANIGYPLAPDVTMDELVDSVRRAVLWLSDNAAELGCDPDRLHVSGHSAGGHLTATMACIDFAEHGGRPNLMAGGCAISGLFDLEPIQLTYLNDNLRMDRDTALRNSPVRLVRPGGPPLLLSVGGTESDEFHRQQEEFAAAWRGRGNEAIEVPEPGMNHFTVLDEFATDGRPLHEAVRTQILG